MITTINNSQYHTFDVGLSDDQRNTLMSMIDDEITNNHDDTVPLYQTYADLHITYAKDWKFFIERMNKYMEDIEPRTMIDKCWANVSTVNNSYEIHTHTTPYTLVYYLQNKYPEYGTNIDNKCILPAIENTCMIMNGKVPHSIVNMPEEVAKNNKRYSIVINYTVEQSLSEMLQEGFRKEQEDV